MTPTGTSCASPCDDDHLRGMASGAAAAVTHARARAHTRRTHGHAPNAAFSPVAPPMAQTKADTLKDRLPAFLEYIHVRRRRGPRRSDSPLRRWWCRWFWPCFALAGVPERPAAGRRRVAPATGRCRCSPSFCIRTTTMRRPSRSQRPKNTTPRRSADARREPALPKTGGLMRRAVVAVRPAPLPASRSCRSSKSLKSSTRS